LCETQLILTPLYAALTDCLLEGWKDYIAVLECQHKKIIQNKPPSMRSPLEGIPSSKDKTWQREKCGGER
jgi:hypothetical protein